MAASSVIVISLSVAVLTQTASANVVLDCLNLFFCDRNIPVCGSNGTHCWHSDNDCERSKFNCLQFFQKDFDKVALDHCKRLTLGGIEKCCIPKTCANKNEPVCGQATTKHMTRKCKWFKNRCALENNNCGVGKDFVEVGKEMCNFEVDINVDRICWKESHAIGVEQT